MGTNKPVGSTMPQPAPGTWGCLVSNPEQAAEAKRLGAGWMVASHAGALSAGPAAVVGLLPFADANGVVLEMGRDVVRAAAPVPVLAGILAIDQFRRCGQLLRMVAGAGYAGIQTFPTVRVLSGGFRHLLVEAGLDSARELEAIGQAAKMGLFASGVVFAEGETRETVAAGANLVVAHLPLLPEGGADQWNADNRLALARAKAEAGGDAAVAAYVANSDRPLGMVLADAEVSLQYESVAGARENSGRTL